MGVGTVRGRTPRSVYALYALHLFLGLGAIGGGTALMADPSGELLGMPSDLLERSPFSSYLIPGIVLLLVFGVLPLLTVVAMIRRPKLKGMARLHPFREMYDAWAWSLYIGFGQIIWIMIQTYMFDAVGAVQVLYMSLGMAIQAVTLLPSVQRHFRVERG